MIKPLFSLLLSTGLLLIPATAKAESSFTPEQKAEIEAMFKDYILENGALLIESVEKNQIEQQAKQLEEARKNIADNSEYLYNSGSPFTGPDDADVTIVEFFDYNCGYCKRALTEIQDVMKDDKKVKVVFKDMPILSPESREAAKWALAAQKQDKYFEFHSALMNYKGAKNEAAFNSIAKDLGLDIDKLEKDKESEEVTARIDKNLEMSVKMGIRGTPAFIIGSEFSPGYIPAAQIKAIVEKVRESNG